MKKIAKDKLLIACSVLLILAGVVAACAPGSAQPVTNSLPPATAQVVTTTLVETRTLPGALGYGTLTPIRAAGPGILTWIAPVGSIVGRGEPLFRIDELPVVAFYGVVPMYRTLEEGTEGADVRQLQENLAELGYSGFSTDGVYTSATARSVRDWQADTGFPITGTVVPGQVVFVPGAVRIAEHTARVGDPIGSASLLAYTDTTRLVTVQLRLVDLALAEEGREVTITLPGGGSVVGQISRVGAVVRDGAVEVTVTIADQESLGSLEAAPVDVNFASLERADVLAVPVSALLALVEGGYGVEIVEGDATRIVPVRTGMFAAGRVEVSGEGIAEGVTVGVAR
jgi:membrane fusion protein, multidrug efflux system